MILDDEPVVHNRQVSMLPQDEIINQKVDQMQFKEEKKKDKERKKKKKKDRSRDP